MPSSPYSAAICGQSRGVVGVQRGDRGLDDVRPAAAQREGAVEPCAPVRDLRGVPARAVLVGEQDELAVGAKRAARRASSSSIIACRPWTSGSSGMSSASAWPSRSASAARSPRPP